VNAAVSEQDEAALRQLVGPETSARAVRLPMPLEEPGMRTTDMVGSLHTVYLLKAARKSS
jgi:hypothetical protein